MTLTISLAQLQSEGACEDKLAAWANFIDHDEAPQPFARLLDCPALGPSEWYWATRCLTAEQRRWIYLRTLILVARRVLPCWEERYPKYTQPRAAVEAAEKALREPNAENLRIAQAAANAAAACATVVVGKAGNAAAAAANVAAAALTADYAAPAASYAVTAFESAAFESAEAVAAIFEAEIYQQRAEWREALESYEQEAKL